MSSLDDKVAALLKAGADHAFRNDTPDLIEVIKAATGADSVRVLKPGMMVTMEYSDSRLNLRVDEHGTILAVTCG